MASKLLEEWFEHDVIPGHKMLWLKEAGMGLMRGDEIANFAAYVVSTLFRCG